MFFLLPCLQVRSTKAMGNGVFTLEPLKNRTIIEVSPVVVMSADERRHLDKTLLHDYIFEWGDKGKMCCLALGFVSIYNHSFNANCEYEMEYGQTLIRIKTVRRIEKGEELFINYNGAHDNAKPLWFDAR
jgi:SET domain-containing protein